MGKCNKNNESVAGNSMVQNIPRKLRKIYFTGKFSYMEVKCKQ
jgi:hypothetical protein